MGNYCGCEKPESNQEHSLESQQTPRTKPEKLPIVSDVVKEYSNKQLNSQSVVVDPSRPQISGHGCQTVNENQQQQANQQQQQQQQQPPVQQLLVVQPQVFARTIQPEEKKSSNKLLIAPQVQAIIMRKDNSSQGSQFRSLPQSQRNQEESKTETLYEKIGKEEGIQTFVDNWMNRVCSDPGLRQFFEKSDQAMLRAKMRMFVKFLIGAEQHWIGQSMQKAHQGMKITDDQFDQFIHHAVESLKMMKHIRLPLLKSVTNLLQSTRDTIVQKEDEESKSNDLIQKLGGVQGITKIVQKLFEKVLADPILQSFFKNSDYNLAQRKYSCFLANLCGDNLEWFGKTMKDAHQGRGISEEHFFQLVFYLRKSMEDLKIIKDAQQTMLDKVMTLKEDIVEQPKPKTLYQKLDERDGYERIMHIWLQNLFHDVKTSHYFEHIMNKDMFVEKATLYFAHYCGAPFKVDDISLSDFKIQKKINEADFDYSVNLLRMNLQKHSIRGDTIQETLALINSFKSKIISYSQQQVDEQMEIQQQQQPLLQDMAVQTSRQKITEQELEENEAIAPQNNINKSVDQGADQAEAGHGQVVDAPIENAQILNDRVDVPPEANQNDENIHAIDAQIGNHSSSSNIQDKAVANFPADGLPQQAQSQSLTVPKSSNNDQHQNLKENLRPPSELLPRSGVSSLNNSPQKKRGEGQQQQPQQFTSYKYVLVDLLSIQNAPSSTYDQDISSSYTNQIILEGELMRYMEKQKTQLNRWILLNGKALLIYKDQLNARSFPMKPLYVIPLGEIATVTTKDAQLSINSTRKQSVYALEIQLKDCYGAIAGSIASLINGQKVANSSPLKDKKGRSQNQQQQQQRQSNINFMSSGYEDSQLVFIGGDKRAILNWSKKIKSAILGLGQGDPRDILFNKSSSDFNASMAYSRQQHEATAKVLDRILNHSLDEKESANNNININNDDTNNNNKDNITNNINDTTMNSQPVKDTQ